MAERSSITASSSYTQAWEAARGRFIRVFKDRLVAVFLYDESLVEAVRAVPGRRWNRVRKMWHWPPLPVHARNLVDFAEKHGFAVHRDVFDIIQDAEKTRALSGAVGGREVEGLYPFQSAGVDFIDRRRRVLLADDMGLGKTIQSIAGIERTKSLPAIVVCPASVKWHWKEEIVRWSKRRAFVIEGRSGEIPRSKYHWYILNYDLLPWRIEALKSLDVQALVIDEVHEIRNEKTIRFRKCEELSEGLPVVLGLSGTPMFNRPKNLYSILKVLRPDLFSDFFYFGTRYCNGFQRDDGHWDFNGKSNLEELNEQLRGSVMVRREKRDVLKDLPEKTRSFIPVEVDRPAYDAARKDFDEWLASVDRPWKRKPEALLRVNNLRKVVLGLKADFTDDWIEKFLSTGRPLVVFSHHRSEAHRVAKKFDGLTVTGEDSSEARNLAVHSFTKGIADLIAATLGAGGVGLNLQRAQDVLFLEYCWTPSLQTQAEDRLHRIGQKDAVTCWYLYAKRTIDEDMLKILHWKTDAIRRGLGGEDRGLEFFLKTMLEGDGNGGDA